MPEATISVKETVINYVLGAVCHNLAAIQLSMVEAALREALKDVEMTVMCTEVSTDLDDTDYMIRNFLASKKMQGIKDSTLNQYRWTAKRFFRETGKNYKDINKNDIKIWLMRRSKEVGRNSLINNKRNLSTLFGWLSDEGYIAGNPMRNIGAMKTLQPENIHMTIEEEMLLRDYICRESVAKRERAIVALLLSTGIRVGEIAAMNRSDVNMLDGSITFRGEKSDRIRTVFLDLRARKYLQDYLMTRSDACPALFVTDRIYNGEPKRIGKHGYENITKNVCVAAGITGKSCTVHVFRRTFATRLADQGAPLEVIQELLGHANADTTSRCYIARSTKRIRDKVSKYMIVA
jgi:site-specific recombinase XerD